MHPVLAKAIHPVAEQIATVTLAEAQVSANSELRRWSGQEVVEHLILSIQKSKEELQRRLKSKNSPFYSCTFIQWVIKFQLLWFGSMPRGIPATHSLSPHRIVAQDGPALAARLLSEAEELSKALALRQSPHLRPTASGGVAPVSRGPLPPPPAAVQRGNRLCKKASDEPAAAGSERRAGRCRCG
jgi:hypothetical protein